MATASFPDEVEATPSILDKEHYEIIDGLRVETPWLNPSESLMAGLLSCSMASAARGTGRVLMETTFVLGPNGNQRRPDVALVSYARWARSRRVPGGEAWEVIPDLAVEVVGPSNTASEIVGKKSEYFRAGVVAVWVIYPEQQEIHVWDSAIACRVLKIGDHLDGGAVLPSFRLAVAELFDVETEPAV